MAPTQKKQIRVLPLLLLSLVLALYLAGIGIALTGNFEAAVGMFAFNTFFSVILFFLIRWHKGA
ncbi:hypothetical protein [Anaerotalea alkaliphila]|uniref:Uncharacterized protein n=1 Tax=Anaerotalea alkaliphila TaxID=2662126 RepID=A0A7X5HXI0_9FIRM|nr:hypothetical protein [Anaerotalea alkaliphila]NDL68430.1 hypothetical protein [Anaerotalea alkaliphila]